MKRIALLLCVMALFGIAGCATPIDDAKLRDLAGHSLNLNQEGWTHDRFVSSEMVVQQNSSQPSQLDKVAVRNENSRFDWSSGRPQCEDAYDSKRVKKQKQNLEDSIAQVIVQFDAHIRNGRDPSIVIFIHGGLVGLDKANREAHSILKAFRESASSDKFPLFVNWDTGIISASSDAFFRNGRVGERNRTTAHGPSGSQPSRLRAALDLSPNQRTVPGQFLAPFRVWREFLSATGRAPFTLGAQTQSLLNTAPLLENFARPQNWDHVVFPRQIDKATARTPGGLVAEVLPGTLRMFSPVYDFLGSGGYTQMTRRAANLVRHESDFANGAYRRCGALARLFDELRAYDAIKLRGVPPSRYSYDTRSNPNSGKVSFNIVAHSLGALVADDIVADNSDLNFRNLLYLNPANTIAGFSNKVIPYLKKWENFETHIYTLHPEREYSEVNYAKAVPVGSLLTWIDRFLNHPLNDLERTLGDWRNLSAALTQIGYLTAEQRSRINIVVFGQSQWFPLMHGDANQPVDLDADRRRYRGAEFWEWHKFEQLRSSDELFGK